jgi:hypothetical protein
MWAGPVMLIAWLAAFVFAGFIPPPHPGASATVIAHKFIVHTFRIRLGMIVTLFAVALLVPFSAVISTQMRRIEGPHSVLAGTQICQGALLSMEFIVPLMVWLTAAYRPRAISPSMLRMLDDMGWIMFVAVISSVCCQIGVIAFAIFLDRRERPIFPRWAGYFNAWVAILLAPAGIIVFFHRGPFSWDGLVSFFIPLTVYTVWVLTMTVLLHRAIETQAAERAEPGAASGLTVEARLAALEQRLETPVLTTN